MRAMSPKRTMKSRLRSGGRSRRPSSMPKISIESRSWGSRSGGTCAAQGFCFFAPLK
jgi:hypothetical protein